MDKTNKTSESEIPVLKLFVALLLVVSYDVGLALIIAYAGARIFNVYPTIWLYIAGIIIELMPDLDIAISKLRHQRLDSSHRNIMHLPLLIMVMLSLSVTVAWIFLTGERSLESLTFILCLANFELLAHFGHDMIGDANWPGVRLWPLPYFLYIGHENGDGSKFGIHIYCYSLFEIANFKLRTLNEWLREFFMKPSFESVFGVLLFGVGVVLMISSLI